MSIESLNQQIIQGRAQFISEVNSYKLRIQGLEQTIQVLERDNKKLKAQIQNNNVSKQKDDTLVNDRIKQARILLKAREDDLYYKQCQIIKLEQTIQNNKRIQNQYQSKYSKQQLQYKELLGCFHQQEKQLEQHITLNESLVKFIEEYVVPNELMIQQKAILVQFNKQLQVQVNELETSNQQLITRSMNYAQLVEQLKLQNMQNNDLMGLAERILESFEVKVG